LSFFSARQAKGVVVIRHQSDMMLAQTAGHGIDDGLAAAVKEAVEYRVRTRRGQPYPAPQGDYAWLIAAVDDGLANAERRRGVQEEAA
jgi:hypothetical protein